MKFPNKYLRNLKPYKLASHKIWTVAPEQRQEILKLDWNESTISPSPRVRERIQALIDEPVFFNLYPATFNKELLDALANYTELPVENIQYFSSSDALHEYICKVFVSVGDPVLILGPSYDNFRLTCQANGADVHFSNYNEHFEFEQERFERDILDIEPAMVYICNPNNPTGNLLPQEYIEHLLNNFPDTLFLIDEAYYEFAGKTAKNLVVQYDNILVSRTMSKAFGLANFRVGYLMSSKDNVQFINKIRNPKSLSTFAQQATIAALSDTDYMWKYVEEVRESKMWFLAKLKELCPSLETYAGYGNFSLLKFQSVEDKKSMIECLAEHNIFVRELTQSSSVECCLRITIGTKSQMQTVLGVIKDCYARH